MLTGKNWQLVRKELKWHSEAYRAELEILSFLRLLYHPNIIELVGCYTYRDTQNFVFPMAAGGDLSNFLKSERPSSFSENSTFLVALSGLSSALSKVHNFVADEFELQLIGCHHDLKASNVLVDKDLFVLADFGLARFKDSGQDSATNFKLRNVPEVAPECIDADSFETHTVHRWTDIWSFGTIMLDVLTYMLRGPEGVVEFLKKRKYRGPHNVSYYSFHKGSAINPGVTLWLLELEKMASRAEKGLIRLIEKMLKIDPASRVTAAEVDAEMSCIALIALSDPIIEQYEVLGGIFKKPELVVEPYIEERRFRKF